VPWTAKDAKKFKKGLTPAQAKKWAKIANGVLADCKKNGGKDCEGKAIRVANSKFTEGVMKETRKIPKGALYFKEPGQFNFKEEKEGEQKSFSMVAYSGKPIKGHFLWGDLAIDVGGMAFPRRAFPILEEHFRDMKIGFSRRKPNVENNNIELDEITLLSNEKAREFYKNAREGFPYEASISVRPTVIEEISEGESAEVNGYKLKGPATVFRKGLVREASVCTFGYDSKTSVSVFNDTEEEELDLDVMKKYDSKEDSQSNEELAEETSEGDDNTNQGGNQTMNLEELREKHPELVEAIQAETKGAMEEELSKKDEENADLKKQVEDLTESKKADESRIAKLEKSESIRRERELKAEADAIFNEKLEKSDIPPRLYDRVRKQLSHGDFVEDEKFDTEKFTEAVGNEIKSWEAELSEAYSKPAVKGLSNADGKDQDNSKDEDLVDRMIGYVSEEEKAA